MAKRAIQVEWNDERRAFRVVSNESMVAQFPVVKQVSDQRNFIQGGEDNQATDQELRKLIGRFEDCLDNRDISAAIAEMQILRRRVLTKILNTRTPLRWLPVFLLKWQDLLSLVDDVRLTPTDLVEYCQELVALAAGWKLIGDIVQARSTLGKSFEVTRRHLKAAFTDAVSLKDGESQTLRPVAIAAKKLLLDCVAFQTTFARNRELFERHEAPPHVQISLSKEFWMLLREAPLSVELALFLAQSLMKQRQFALVTRFLEHSPFIGESAELTLVHARALAYGFFYRQSIQIAQSFAVQVDKGAMVSVKLLRVHCDNMKKLLECRERSDEWLRLDQYDKAVSGYEECIALVDPADHKQMAVLLFGHANALLGLEQVSAAINNLRKSLQLDPASKIAWIRLQTACLQLETERIKKELSGNR